jgi:DNA-binding beta-propeller fold protein YncE
MSRTAFASIAFVLLVVEGSASALAAGERGPYRSPFDVAFSPDGGTLAVSDRTAGRAAIVDVAGKRVLREVRLAGSPTGVAWAAGGSRVYVAEYGAGTVAEIEAQSGKVARRLAVGLRPVGLALAPERRLLIAANTVTDDVSVVDLESGKERARIAAVREPFFVAVAADESLAAVGNLLPAGSAADPMLSASVSLLDLERLERVADIRLPSGSTSVREVAVSPDGRWVYAVHTVGRFNVPTTQVERGWINTNGLSVIDPVGKRLYATLLLDHPFEGAPDPWGIVLSRDGKTLWTSLRGIHRLARVRLDRLHRFLAGDLPESRAAPEAHGPAARNIWLEIKRNPAHRELLVNDLSALHLADAIERFPLSGNGPRGIDLSPDGERLAVALYFSGAVALVDAASGKVTSTISLGPSPEPDLVRRGEITFHDANYCFQHWMSCSTCHPDGGRTDGLRWDLLNDGLGTPQRTRSLLWSYRVDPTTGRGVRENIEFSVKKGLLFQLHMPERELTDALLAYLKSLEPEPSPYLAGGKLSPAAERGKALFEGKAECAECHPGDLGADQKPHDVGSQGEFDRPDEQFYSMKLVELYRTAPYLHDGRSATLREVFTRYDPQRKHGKTADLTPAELDDLIEYLKSR